MEYHPSFTTPRTPLRFIPAESSPSAFLRRSKRPTLLRQVQPPGSDRTAPPSSKAATRLAISGPLAQRARLQLASRRQADGRESDPPEHDVSSWEWEQTGSQSIASCSSSSGQRVLDQAASRDFRRMRFAPADEEITWGIVTIEWGDDVFVKDAARRQRKRHDNDSRQASACS